MPNHDLKLARALRGLSLERLPTLWDQLDALAHIPLMVIRGANSDMLASSTVNAMLARRGQLEVVVIPDQGHRHSWPSPWRYGGLQPLLHLAMSPHGTDGPSPIQKVAAGIAARHYLGSSNLAF